MCNPKDELVRMIRTIFGIDTIRQFVVSVLEVDVKLNLPNLNRGTSHHIELNIVIQTASSSSRVCIRSNSYAHGAMFIACVDL